MQAFYFPPKAEQLEKLLQDGVLVKNQGKQVCRVGLLTHNYQYNGKVYPDAVHFSHMTGSQAVSLRPFSNDTAKWVVCDESDKDLVPFTTYIND